MNTIAVSAEDKRRFAIREPQPDCRKQVECGMYCPASPSQEHDDGGLVSDDLPDLPAYGLPAAATRLGDGSYLQAVDNDPYSMTAVEASDLQTAAEASDLQPLMDWICDSPAPTCAATLEPQQQQQQQQQLILPGAAAAGWSSQGLLNAAAPAMAPRTAQGAAAAKLNLGFTARFRGSAGAAAASSCVPVGNTSNASGSAEYAAAYTAGPAAQLAAFGGAAYAMQQPEEGAEEQQQEEQEEELQVQQARMSKRPRRPTQQQQQQQQDQDQAEHEQLEQQEAAELQLSPAQISQKREKWQKKLNKLSAADKQQLSKLNLPKATIQPSKGDEQMLAALGVADEPAASQYFYVIRGPQQTLRCSIMRRITKLLPETYPIYKEVNEGSGLTKKGLQQKKDDCLLFFNKVLAEHLAAEFTPTQAECAPLRELDYVARLLSMVAGRTITAAQVNDVFIPGEKNYTVNKSAAAELLGDAPESFTVPLGGSYQQEARSNSASNISASSALPAQPGEAAAAAARLGVSRRAPKRPGGVSSSSTPLKKRR